MIWSWVRFHKEEGFGIGIGFKNKKDLELG